MGWKQKNQLIWGEIVSSGSHQGIADFGSKGDRNENLATEILKGPEIERDATH